jgi:TolA-binding protein
MIKYESDMFGLRQLGIWHGSAVFRAILPAAFSSAVLVAYSYGQQQHNNNNNDSMENNNKIVEQPYTITVFIAFFSFLLAFRLNYSYQRYWEACTQIYAMQSQWVDSAVCLASFHYQCDHYTEQRPLTFGNHPALRNDTRERERQREQTLSGVEEWIDQHDETNKAQELQQQQQNELELEQNEQQIQIQTQQKQRRRGGGIFRWFVKKPPKASTTRSKERPTLLAPTNDTVPRPPVAKAFKPINRNERTTSNEKPFSKDRTNTNTKPSSKAWRTSFAHHGGSGNKTTNDLNDDNDNEDEDTRNTTKRNLLQLTGLESPTPSLFLQEAAHLYSLLSAVAMSSLRVDIEGAQSPLTEHVPGLPIPPVNPDQLSQEIKFTYYESPHKVQAFVSFCLGLSRSPGHRTMYNAARPFRVIGGVSDSECDLLLQAKGPYAQMALCNMWLKEFITREYLNGSTGPVAPPIVGRVYQFISGGVAA